MRRLGNGILLEAPVDSVAAQSRLGAQWLVSPLAVRTGKASAIDPLDADLLTNLNVLDELAPGYDDTGALVPPTRGILVSRGQSPIMAWRSVWQTPENLILIKTSSGPGLGTGIFL